MKRQRTNGTVLDILWLLSGSVAYLLVGWRWNAAIAAWITPVFLIRFFRNQQNGFMPLLAVPVLYLSFLANMYGAWDLPAAMQLYLPLLVVLPIIIALYVDRALNPRLPQFARTLVFPTVYVTLDYLLTFTPFGSLFSFASTQFAFKSIMQLSSITGIWGVAFLITWTASVANEVWENRGDMAKVKKPLVAFAAVALLVLGYGAVRISRFPETGDTVKVAGITIPHPRDYWALLDNGTPRGEAIVYRNEIGAIEDALFLKSTQAAENGAKIIFWSEGNGVVLEEDIDRFHQRAAAFAVDHNVYFAPAVLELRYGTYENYNRVKMFSPDGTMVYDYQKTKSWLPVDADGQIYVVETPYGTVSSTICFDMDFPEFIRQAAVQGTDIMLVPGYDSARIRPFHTELALMRGIEGGFSVVRQVNDGTSMASDHRGIVLSRQDHFTTEDRTMYVDVPTRGVATPYQTLGDWFAWLSIAGFLTLAVAGYVRTRSARQKKEDL